MVATGRLSRLKKIQFWLMVYLFFAFVIWGAYTPWIVTHPQSFTSSTSILPFAVYLLLVGLPAPFAFAWFLIISKRIHFLG